MELLRLAEIQHCIHCGLCLQSCPTYAETGNEALSPRGRIYSLRAVAEGRLNWKDIRPQLDSCLGCLACQTACPSPVHYAEMLEIARAELEHRLPLPARLLRLMMLRVASSPGTMRLSAEMMERVPLLGELLGRAVGGAPLPEIRQKKTDPIPSRFEAVGQRRGTVTLLAGCVQRVALPDVNLAAARCLAANGFDVELVDEPECCGALLSHFGYPDAARPMAERAGSPATDALVVTSGGCGAFIKEVGGRKSEVGSGVWGLGSGPDTRHPIPDTRYPVPVYDFAEFLVNVGWTAPLMPPDMISEVGNRESGIGNPEPGTASRTPDPVPDARHSRPDTPHPTPDTRYPTSRPLRVALHDACHLEHGQGVKAAPREVLSWLPGVEAVELDESYCCGSAGMYNVYQPKMARRLLDRKLAAIARTDADVVLSSNPGCTLWLRQGLAERGLALPVMHLAEIVAACLRGS